MMGGKVGMHHLVTYLDQTPIYEWFVVRGSSKNKYIQDLCSKEMELCAQNFNHHSRPNNVHIWKNLYDYLMNMRIFTLMMNKIFIEAPKIMRKVATALMWIC